MRGQRRLLRVGEYLIACAARLLPREIRDERYREWAAELPAILCDPDTRLAVHRAVRMLGYAAGTIWGTALAHRGARGRLTAVMAVVAGLYIADSLWLVVWHVWDAAHAPGDWVNYLWIALGSINLAFPCGILAERIRHADEPKQGVRDAVLAYGAQTIPGWLLSGLLHAVGAERSDLPRKPGAACSPAPGPVVKARRVTAVSAEQAISRARDTVLRFHLVRLRPGYRTAEVDEFIARIEATLTTGGQHGQVVTFADVDTVKFGTTRRGGYDEKVVDEALDHYVDALIWLSARP